MKVFWYFSPPKLQVGSELSQYRNVCSGVSEVLYLMGAYRKLYFWKNFIECFLIHAVDISTSVHSDHNVVAVGALGVAHYGKSEVFPFIKLSHVGFKYLWLTTFSICTFGGFCCLTPFSSIWVSSYPGGSEEGWLTGWLFSCSGTLCGNVQFYDSLCTWHSWQDTFVPAGVHVFHSSCTCPPSLGVFWNDD